MCCFLSSVFFGLWPRFCCSWVSKLEPSWPSWIVNTLPKAFKIQYFGSMCPRCFPRGFQVIPKGIPRKAQRSIFEGFLIDLKTIFCYFWHAFLISIQNNCSHEHEKNAEPATYRLQATCPVRA